MNRKILVAATLAVAALAVTSAKAGVPITSSLSANWFEVKDGSDPDFNLYSTPDVAPGSGLTNGMPTATGGVNDIVGGELTWWDPSKNSNVIPTPGGPATITLPYNSNMFAPYSTGTNDENYFETAYFTGHFTLSDASTVSFSLGSDDDSFIYVDGKLIGQNPGVHAITTVNFSSGTLSAGSHSIEVFYADRENVAAQLQLSADVNIYPGVPEPAQWALMLIGFFGLGSMVRFVNRKTYLLTSA